jgi:hypothetical protein
MPLASLNLQSRFSANGRDAPRTFLLRLCAGESPLLYK